MQIPVSLSMCYKQVYITLFCVVITLAAAEIALGAPPPELADFGMGRYPSTCDDDSVIYSQNFELGAGGWGGVDLTDPGIVWHRETFNAYSGTYSWWCGQNELMGYDNNWLQYLVSPAIDLSDALEPVLTCSLYWAVEAPSVWGDYDGWDGCNVWIFNPDPLVNDWEVLIPESGYTCQSLYSFGWRWEMGPGIPGWAGNSSGWTSARFDLSNYLTSGIKIRFAFSSDNDFCTANDPSLYGFFIDNIEIKDSQQHTYLSNFAEGYGFPSEFTFETGDPSGDFWDITVEEYHSPIHSFNCDDCTFLSDALVSPYILIPNGRLTELRYWVYCDMPDYDGDQDGNLDDFYVIEVSPLNSPNWTQVVYDWAHNGSQLVWVQREYGYSNGYPTENIDLTPWAGQNVQIRFRVITDGNDDGGQGNGLFIDDVELCSTSLPANDVGAYRLIVPFPTYQGLNQVNCSVDIVNYGRVYQPQVPSFYSINGNTTALIPWPALNPRQSITRWFNWMPSGSGFYNFKAFTQLSNDEEPANDSCFAGLVEVTSAGIFELGYDHRQVTYLNDIYWFNYDQGSGALAHFTPQADGLSGDLYGYSVKAMFYSPGTFNLRIFADGAPGQPGAEVYMTSLTVESSEIYPNWAEFPIFDAAYLQGGHPNFWVWLEVTSTNNAPQITGHITDCFSTGHFFNYNGSNPTEFLYNFNIRTVLTDYLSVAQGETGVPYTLRLLPNSPNPFNSTTRIIFTLPVATETRLDVIDLLGREVARLLDQRMEPGEHHLIWDAEGLSSSCYWLRLRTETAMKFHQMILLK